MFVIVDFKTVVYADYINRLTTYLPTNFHLPRCNVTLIIFIKPTAKESVHLSTILLFLFNNILPEKNYVFFSRYYL
jgi:hypothetical protein